MRLTAGPIQWTPKRRRMVLVLVPVSLLVAVPWVIYVGWYCMAHNGQPPSRAIASIGYFGTFAVDWFVLWALWKYKFNRGREDGD